MPPQERVFTEGCLMPRMLALAVTVCGLLGCAAAKDKPRDYPLSATVVSFHSQAEVRGSATGTNGTFVGSTGTYERRVYVLKTNTGTLEITGWEHGSKRKKRPPLSIGQDVKYRTDGTYLYTVLEDGKEHRYYLVSAAIGNTDQTK